MLIEPQINTVSIVLVGSFNPAIFHPAWFLANGIFRDEDFKVAKIELIHPEIAIFNVGEWLSVRVERERFAAETREPPFIRLCDFVVKTFKEALLHTPINQIGINRQLHFSVGDNEICDKIGKLLAPQEPWGEWAQSFQGKTREKRGGLISISMIQLELEDRDEGHIRTKVEPSARITDGTGIYVEINDHYDFSNKEPKGSTLHATDLLEKHFDDSIRRSEWIIDQIMSLKEKV